jgi:hypothetical protein
MEYASKLQNDYGQIMLLKDFRAQEYLVEVLKNDENFQITI